MKKMCLIFLTLLFLLSACNSIKEPQDTGNNTADLKPKDQQPEDGELTFVKKPIYGSDFIMRLNDDENEVFLPGNIQVKLIDVKDNRCPIGAQCIRAGEVYVYLEVDFVGEDPFDQTLVLGSSREGETSVAEFFGTTFLTLKAVEPQKTVDGKVKDEDITVFFAVSMQAIQ